MTRGPETRELFFVQPGAWDRINDEVERIGIDDTSVLLGRARTILEGTTDRIIARVAARDGEDAAIELFERSRDQARSLLRGAFLITLAHSNERQLPSDEWRRAVSEGVGQDGDLGVSYDAEYAGLVQRQRVPVGATALVAS
jgi:hypothetical protein